jgi:hypothetical protein
VIIRTQSGLRQDKLTTTDEADASVDFDAGDLRGAAMRDGIQR